MKYAILHFETKTQVVEYTLQATCKSLLQDKIYNAIKTLNQKPVIYYFDDYETCNSFVRGVFRIERE